MSERWTRAERGLAAIGVILSLLFVGLEVRQNTQAVRGAAMQAISDQGISQILEGAADPDWVRILTLLGGGGKFADLSPDDQMRFGMRASVSVRIMDNRYRQVKLGILDESGLSVGTGVRNTTWYRSQYFRDFWQAQNIASEYDPEFVDFMETTVMGIR